MEINLNFGLKQSAQFQIYYVINFSQVFTLINDLLTIKYNQNIYNI